VTDQTELEFDGIEKLPLTRFTSAPSSLVVRVAFSVNRVREVARLPTVACVVHPGPRAMSGPPRVNDTLVVARSRWVERLAVQKFNHVAFNVVRARPLMFPLPLWFHYAFGWFCERTMTVPLIALAQVRILSESVVEPLPACDDVPDDLKSRRPFADELIRGGLPERKAFGLADCRCFAFMSRKASSH